MHGQVRDGRRHRLRDLLPWSGRRREPDGRVPGEAGSVGPRCHRRRRWRRRPRRRGQATRRGHASTSAKRSHHGIVGLAYLPDGNLLFTTHVGQLYRIEPRQSAPAAVTALGDWPVQAPAYGASLFALGGREGSGDGGFQD